MKSTLDLLSDNLIVSYLIRLAPASIVGESKSLGEKLSASPLPDSVAQGSEQDLGTSSSDRLVSFLKLLLVISVRQYKSAFRAIRENPSMREKCRDLPVRKLVMRWIPCPANVGMIAFSKELTP